MAHMVGRGGFRHHVREAAKHGLPMWGTCNGAPVSLDPFARTPNLTEAVCT